MVKNQEINIDLNFFPHQKQKEVIQKINDESLFCITVCAGRQSGKTKLLINMLVYKCLKEKNLKHLFVMPVDSQLRKNYNEISILLEKVKKVLVKEERRTQGDMRILFVNGSEIIFRSAAAGDSIRGLTVDYLWVDECAFIKKDVLDYVLLPTLTIRGKKMILFSTPKGKNFFYEYFYKQNNKFSSIKFTSYDNPLANVEFIELQKSVLPDVIFNQEYMAEFVDSSSVFIDIDKRCTLKEKYTKEEEVFGGIDVGLVNDKTVVTLFNKKKEMVFLKVYPNTDTSILVEQITTELSRWNLKKCYIETNGIGLPIFQLLRKKIKVEPFTTTPKSKNEIINDLISDFNSGIISLINDKDLKFEFENFQFFSLTGKFGGGVGHDDIVMSTAIALYSLKSKRQGNYAVV